MDLYRGIILSGFIWISWFAISYHTSGAEYAVKRRLLEEQSMDKLQ